MRGMHYACMPHCILYPPLHSSWLLSINVLVWNSVATTVNNMVRYQCALTTYSIMCVILTQCHV